MPSPIQVYAGYGSGTSNIMSNINDPTILSGPNWIPNLIGNLKSKKKNWYCLDLLGKYHRDSKLKQFHALTFYFRNTKNKVGRIITSMLPESFTYSIGGNYGNPVTLMGEQLINAVAQEFSNGNVSTSFCIDTSQVWQSPKRMDIVFRIPVLDDSATGSNVNYQEAIDLFGEAILPEIARNGTYESTPGPGIINSLEYRARHGKAVGGDSLITRKLKEKKDKVKDTIKSKIGGEEKKWDRVSVQVGGLLLLDWCVIKDLKVTFPNTKAMVLHNFIGTTKDTDYQYRAHLEPIQAELEVTVSTVMGMTRATFKDMLYQQESVKATASEIQKSEDDMSREDQYIKDKEEERKNQMSKVSTGGANSTLLDAYKNPSTPLTLPDLNSSSIFGSGSIYPNGIGGSII